MTISAASTTSNPLLSSSSTTSNPLASASSTTSNPLLVNNYPSSSTNSAQQSAGQQILTSLGGTSINVMGIESSLITAARAPQQKIINTAVQTLYTAKTSVTALSQGITALQTAADAINTVNGLNQLQFTDTDGAVSATAGGNGAAVQGAHQITVSQLATAQETLSSTFSSATDKTAIPAGYQLSITSGGKTLSVGSSTTPSMSITDLANAINGQDGAVTAQVVNTGSGTSQYSLMLSGKTGAASSFTISESGPAGSQIFSANVSDQSFSSPTSYQASSNYTLNLNYTDTSLSPSSPSTLNVPVAIGDNLTTIANSINTAGVTHGISASVVLNSQGKYSLQISGPQSAAISIAAAPPQTGGSVPSDALTFSANTIGNVQDAQDAKFNVDGINYTRSSNTASDVLAGVSLTLNAVNTNIGAGVSTLGVSYNTTAIATLLNNFVTAFNNYQTFVSNATGQTSTTDTTAGSLQKYPEVASDLQSLSNLLVNKSSLSSGSISTWADFGVSIQVNGQLSFDQSTFVSKFNASPGDVIKALSNDSQSSPSAFAVGPQGLAGDISVAVQKMLSTGGTIQNVTGQITSGMTDEQTQQDALNLYIQNLQTQYDAQFSSLQSILSQFSSTSSQLQQTYNPSKSSSG